MSKIVFSFTLLILVFFFSACGPARFVEPLKKRENAVAIDLGGPLVNIPGVAPMPMPFSSITYGRGISNNLTLHGSWYSTAAIFGVAQFEVNGTYGFWRSRDKKHGASAILGFNTAMDVFENEIKFWPKLDAHYYFKYNFKALKQDDLLTSGGKPAANLLYAGIGTWYELDKTRAHNEEQQTFVVPMLNIGHDLNWKRWTFKTEIKLIAPFTSNEDIVLDYISLTGKKGATGLYFGLIRKF
ncbi:hypothetical protein CW751_12255 [Brumimicrobium salinarum]|uniref:Outer membrane protein beta-barrel domain-containing protein n=1 Tax=Brumimicrobium salinarum TaxID=2058658 RepID=A0A2I0R0S5_9FLAO|nr:hypothetical protein [Brumimicrobium salinarum]PKR79990.1 hypothetical protein CW751_12255 [Brumimicrobium salinarum]